MEYFHYDDGACEPFFRRIWKVPFKTRPLRIKDSKVEMELSQLINKHDEVKRLLGSVETEGDSILYRWTNMIREVLKRKLYNFKSNKFQSLLVYHLYEAMPEHDDLRKLLPGVDVHIPDHNPLSFVMLVRQKNRPKTVKKPDFGSYHQLFD